MDYCWSFDEVYITFDVLKEKVHVCKCCLKRHSPLGEYTLEEWEKINILSEIKKYENKFPSDMSIIKGYCPVKVCYTDKKIEIKQVQVSLDFQCNLKCLFCGTRFERDILLSKPQYLKKLKNAYFNTLYQLKGHSLILKLTDGGEPFFWKKETENFLNSLQKGDFSRIFFATNATFFSEKFISEVLEPHKDILEMIVSLNAWNKESYKNIMGFDFFDKVIQSINILKSKNFNFYVSFVVTSEDELENIKKISEFLNQAHITTYIKRDVFNESLQSDLFGYHN